MRRVAGPGTVVAADAAPTVYAALPEVRRRAVIASGAGATLVFTVIAVAARQTLAPGHLVAAVALATVAALAARAVVPWVSGADRDGSATGQVVDLSSVVFVLAALLVPLALIPLVCLPRCVLDRLQGRRPLFALVLNTLVSTATTALAGATRVVVHGAETVEATGVRWALAAWTAAAVYTGGVYVWGVAGRWVIRGVEPEWGRLRETLPVFQEAGMAATAVLGATLWRIGPLLVVYMVGPLAILQRLLYFREVQVAARTDGKTGLLNYRYFEECGRRAIARARRTDTALALLVVDMDRLRDVNNAFGHQSGDLALAHVARVLSHGARRDDLVCRFGGEEFLLLLPGTSLDAAAEVAERLRHGVRATPVRLVGRDVHVSVSIGVAALEEGVRDLDALIALADNRVFAAKGAGRDRVVATSSV